ncbi:hypothetical protein DI272_27215 [Streptomyces sp. Act143]|uniref:hypothetical protein n=1 Tax=Streptomyces sp. Act143 TaxID=2200760 RepID=UPI000D681F07|nr:hypothetical protein [Streptomyces sp. Act143]PWI17439.1 hypothetical protein DI272_27215 [Streptomyces sp. Act143]
MTQPETDLLPIGGAALASDPRVLEVVRATAARTGVDYTDDRAVSVLLAERRTAAHAAQHRPLAWVAGLTLVAVVCWVFTAMGVPALGPTQAALAGPPLIAAVAALVHVRKGWRRELEHPALAGYREVLGVARAHGLPLAHIPPWLEGRPEAGGGGGKAVLPIPTYPKAETPAVPTPAPSTAPAPHASAPVPHASVPAPVPAPVPPKPAAVAEYERIADTGGWHDEAGCLLIIAGAVGAGWAWSETEPIGYGALALIPLAFIVWLIGRNQGSEKARLRAEATEYVRAVAAAQAAGAQVPELSPQLQKLLHGTYVP